MDRFLTRPLWLLAALLLTVTVATNAGCSLVATGLWAVFPNDAPAKFEGLDNHKVVVICQPPNSFDVGNASVSTQLAKAVARKLRENGDDIEIIPQSKVDDWLDHNEMESFVKIGETVGADKVVAIELGHFSLGSGGTTLLQGDADAEVTVYDVKTGEIDFSREPLETLYPLKTPVSRDSTVSEGAFRRVFIDVLADQIARTFYAYESREAYARDVYWQR